MRTVHVTASGTGMFYSTGEGLCFCGKLGVKGQPAVRVLFTTNGDMNGGASPEQFEICFYPCSLHSTFNWILTGLSVSLAHKVEPIDDCCQFISTVVQQLGSKIK